MILAAALALLATAQEEGVPPPAYLECARAYAAKLADIDRTEEPVFRCGRDYFDSLPGSSGTTADMNDAYVEAIGAGSAYREKMLEPALIAAMESAAEDQEMDVRKRLAEVLAAADEADDLLCRLQYDLFVQGTMRTLVAGSCHIERSDDLTGSLIGLQHMLGN